MIWNMRILVCTGEPGNKSQSKKWYEIIESWDVEENQEINVNLKSDMK